MSPRLSPAGARPIAAVTLAAVSLVAAAAVGSVFVNSARDAWAAIDAEGPAGPADGILLIVAVLGAALTLWLGLGMALSALSALPGALGQAFSALSDRLAPSAARKVVAFVLGTTLTAALVPGTAVARSGHDASRPSVVVAAQMAFGRLADAAPDASFRLVNDAVAAADSADAAPSPSWSQEGRASTENRATSGARGATPASGVAVKPGDTLWSIAAHRLGPAASSTEIDAEWHRWFAANRAVIGDDANVIEPGQLLSRPATPPVNS